MLPAIKQTNLRVFSKGQIMTQPQEQESFTQTPNAFFDKLLEEIDTLSELKVTLALIRKICGWIEFKDGVPTRKEGDEVSFSQFVEMTGLSRPMVKQGIDAALARGTITRTSKGMSYYYQLNLANYQGEGYQSKRDAQLAQAREKRFSITTSLATKPETGLATKPETGLATKHTKEIEQNKDLNKLTTPLGVAAPPLENDFEVIAFYEPEPQSEEQLPMPSIPTDGVIPGPATDKGRVGANSVHIPSSPQLDLVQEVKGFEAEGGGRDMTHVGKARDKPRPKPKSKAKEPDEKEKPGLHIALMTYKKEFRSLPHKRQFQGIIDQVGDNPDRLVKWGKACHNWVMRGWDPFNVAGLLDSFEKGNYENDHFKQQRGSTLGLDSREKQLDQRPRVLTGTGWGGGKSGEELQAEWDNYKL